MMLLKREHIAKVSPDGDGWMSNQYFMHADIRRVDRHQREPKFYYNWSNKNTIKMKYYNSQIGLWEGCINSMELTFAKKALIGPSEVHVLPLVIAGRNIKEKKISLSFLPGFSFWVFS